MDYRPPDSSVHGDSPSQNTGVDSCSLLQKIFPTQGLNRGLPHCRRILSHQGSPNKHNYSLSLPFTHYSFLKKSSPNRESRKRRHKLYLINQGDILVNNPKPQDTKMESGCKDGAWLSRVVERSKPISFWRAVQMESKLAHSSLERLRNERHWVAQEAGWHGGWKFIWKSLWRAARPSEPTLTWLNKEAIFPHLCRSLWRNKDYLDLGTLSTEKGWTRIELKTRRLKDILPLNSTTPLLWSALAHWQPYHSTPQQGY